MDGIKAALRNRSQLRRVTSSPGDPALRSTRRGALRAGLSMTAAGIVAGLLRAPDDAQARRNACQVRCGGDRRLCRNDCRHDYVGAAERQCKRGCNLLRDHCFKLCEFRPLRLRLARG